MATQTATKEKPKTGAPEAAPESKGELVLHAPRLPYHPAVKEHGLDEGQWKTLVEAVFPNAQSVDAVLLAVDYCKARKLDIFKKVVHIVPIWDSKLDTGRQINGKPKLGGYRETVWPGVAEHRITAMRTGSYAGADPAQFGPMKTHIFEWEEEGPGGPERRNFTMQFPEWCQITVYRMVQGARVPFPGPRIYWLETYARKGRSVLPNDMWQKRAVGQLEKCFGPETEVLTDQGFQRFDSVTGRIMQVTEHGVEPTDAKPFRQPYSGEMIQAGGDALNFRVTPNHDMVTTDGKIEARALLDQATSVDKFRIPISVSGTHQEAPISDQSIKLAAVFACDGYRRPYGTFCVAVSRPYKVEAIETIGGYTSKGIRRCAGDEAHTETRVIVTRADKTIFVYDEDVLGGLIDLDKQFDRDVLLSLSRRQARLLVDTMLTYDGADNGRGTMRFFSSNQEILAAFEIAAIAAGYAVSRRRERISDIGGPNYMITVSDKESLPALRYSASQIGRDGAKAGLTAVETNPDGEVWCCRVPSGVIVVRREGLSMLCGNCAEAAALRRAFPEEFGDEWTAEEAGAIERAAENAVDVTPAAERPKRDEEPKKADPFTVVNADGQVFDFEQAAESVAGIASFFAEAKTKDALEGIWESNNLPGQLRDRGFPDLAQAVHDAYAEAAKALDPKPQPASSSQPAAEAGATEQVPAPAPAPRFTAMKIEPPIAEGGGRNWTAWGKAMIEQIKLAQTEADVSAIIDLNVDAFAEAKDVAPKAYASVDGAKDKRKKQIVADLPKEEPNPLAGC